MTVNCGQAALQGQSFIPMHIDTGVRTIQQCIDICDNNSSCEQYSLDTSTNTCYTYEIAGRPIEARENWVYGIKNDPCSRACKRL